MLYSGTIGQLRWTHQSYSPPGRGWIQADVQLTSGTENFNNDGAVVREQWNHVVLRYDGSSLRWYINGERVSNLTGFSGQALNSNNRFDFGYPFGVQADSYIDEVRYSRSGLSECRIQTDYANQMYPNKADDGANGLA